MTIMTRQFDRLDNMLPLLSKPFIMFVGEADTLQGIWSWFFAIRLLPVYSVDSDVISLALNYA